ncbi:hypothetical protein EV385_6008 [Krasilnikovia cinnamomea]|uniref:Tocopherol cyclase-like protein n=1 Tax=Krasilnikovia cinnamomea TaxID=349313 RepID=A0A4Q7ZT86_9ACTN|nr:hypothetical protein [Krasilnikovia cinnamomea]RZU54071.1 hypothetical protein EV385_6008 [Krasilnikovia cinnamomea]
MITTMRETMTGKVRLTGESGERPIRMTLRVTVPGALHPLTDLRAAATGRVEVPGFADDPAAAGTMDIAPIRGNRIGYRLGFTAHDGRRLWLDGAKAVTVRRPLASMTRLPARLVDATGAVVGEARLVFHLRSELLPFLLSMRMRRTRQPWPAAPTSRDGRSVETGGLLRSRWRGQPGRLEVWYTTLTDPATGTGVWLHHELVAPTDGSPARAHGWAAVFPPAAAPTWARFGPDPWPAEHPADGYAAGAVSATSDELTGTAGDLRWRLKVSGGAAPLFTFPRWAWHRELLPAAQVVAVPAARFTGTIRVGDRELALTDAPGNTARIYGHGNARRWAWLHADLGDGDVCEVVAAVSTRPGLNRLAPLPFVRLRVDGEEFPSGDPLLAALRFRARLGRPRWTVTGRDGDRRLTVEVTMPPERTLAVPYTDPDGAPAVCHNCEVADAVVRLERRGPDGWREQRRWALHGTAHAEVGERD